MSDERTLSDDLRMLARELLLRLDNLNLATRETKLLVIEGNLFRAVQLAQRRMAMAMTETRSLLASMPGVCSKCRLRTGAEHLGTRCMMLSGHQPGGICGGLIMRSLDT